MIIAGLICDANVYWLYISNSVCTSVRLPAQLKKSIVKMWLDPSPFSTYILVGRKVHMT